MTIFRPGGGQAQGESKKVKIVELSGDVTAWGFFLYTQFLFKRRRVAARVYIKCDRQEALTSSIPLQGEVQKKQGEEKAKREEARRIRSEYRRVRSRRIRPIKTPLVSTKKIT